MMVLADESSCQVMDHSVSESMFGLAISTASGVDLQFAGETVACIGPNPHFHASLYGLHWHVLLESKPALVFYHCLVDASVFGRPVFIGESPGKDIQQWPDLEQLVVGRIVVPQHVLGCWGGDIAVSSQSGSSAWLSGRLALQVRG